MSIQKGSKVMVAPRYDDMRKFANQVLTVEEVGEIGGQPAVWVDHPDAHGAYAMNGFYEVVDEGEEHQPCHYCQGLRKSLETDKFASDFRPDYAHIEGGDDGYVIALGTEVGSVFLLIDFCPKCGRNLMGA